MKAVVAVSKHKDVMFGYVEDSFELGVDERVILKKSRQCLYFPTEQRGFMSLAAKGPVGCCELSMECPETTLLGTVRLCLCTEEAEKKWNSFR